MEALLLTQLDTAELAWNTVLCLVADTDYGAFATEVQTLSGVTISPTAATILAGDAQYLATDCGATRARAPRPR